jgi:hypothetical protein
MKTYVVHIKADNWSDLYAELSKCSEVIDFDLMHSISNDDESEDEEND